MTESVNKIANKGKINWLLILQAWAMLWVVIGHATLNKEVKPVWDTNLVKIAYMFHMQLFIVVSGYLFRLTRLNNQEKWSYGKILQNKFVRLGVPGLFFSIVALALKGLFPGEMNRQVSQTLGGVLYTYLYPCENAFQEIWFVVVLMWMFLLTPVWRIALKNVYTKAITLAVVLVLSFVNPKTEFLCIDRACGYAICFYSGMLLSYVKINNPVKALHIIAVMLVGGALMFCGFIGIEIPMIEMISCIMISIGIAFLLDRYLPYSFKGFRNYTYQIYLMGIFAQIFVKILYRHCSMPYLIGWILCVVAGLYIPVLISKVCEWINWKPLLICVGLKQAKK